MENVDIIVILLFGITFLAVLNKKRNFPFAIILVLSGIVISLIPGLPTISLKPDVIFLFFYHRFYTVPHGIQAGMISKQQSGLSAWHQ
jgi:hypothetical protein